MKNEQKYCPITLVIPEYVQIFDEFRKEVCMVDTATKIIKQVTIKNERRDTHSPHRRRRLVCE